MHFWGIFAIFVKSSRKIELLMKIVIASDSFKGCLSSSEVARAAEAGVRDVLTDAEVVPVAVADGGEGLVDALCDALGGEYVSARVSDPLGRPVEAKYCIAGDTAVIEVAAACGLALLSQSERNPLLASTQGVGELLLDAARRGCKRFLVGLGGSATNDGGRGMIETPGLLETLKGMEFTVACDVDTPFVGPVGASRVFGPQKGASPEDVEILETRLQNYASEIEMLTGVDVRNMPGAGAAGGLGGAFRAFLAARLRPGIELVLDAIGFDEIIRGADLVITGEGRSDFQTPRGKTPSGVLARTKRQGIPTALVSGAISDCPELRAMGFASMTAATPEGMPLEMALSPEVAAANIRNAVSSLVRDLLPRC